jgi:hypothetical protein
MKFLISQNIFFFKEDLMSFIIEIICHFPMSMGWF